MNSKLKTWIWSTDLGSPNRVLVLLALAEFVDGDMYCWPGKAKLSEMTRLGFSTVKRTLADMVETGILIKQERFDKKGMNLSNGYTVNINWTPPEKKEDEPDLSASDSTMLSTQRVGGQRDPGVRVTPKHSISFINRVKRNLQESNSSNTEESVLSNARAKKNQIRKLEKPEEIAVAIWNEWKHDTWVEHKGLTKRAQSQLKELVAYFGNDWQQGMIEAILYAKSQQWWRERKISFVDLFANSKGIDYAEKQRAKQNLPTSNERANTGGADGLVGDNATPSIEEGLNANASLNVGSRVQHIPSGLVGRIESLHYGIAGDEILLTLEDEKGSGFVALSLWELERLDE